MRIHHQQTARRALRAALAVVIIPTLMAVAAPPAQADGRPARWKSRVGPTEHPIRHERHPKHQRQVQKRARPCPCGRRVHAGRPTWCPGPERVLIYESHPFYLHGGFGVYFGGGAINVAIGSRPPRGYRYIDPVCHRSFASVAQYRNHLRGHDHPGFLEVAPIDDRIACR